MKIHLVFALLFLLSACCAHKRAKETPVETKPPKEQVKPSKEQLRRQIIEDTKAGGGLDFFSYIQGHEQEEVKVKPGVMSTRLGVALYQWGKANVELGVPTLPDALEIWSAFKGRAATQREQDGIKLGWEKRWE